MDVQTLIEKMNSIFAEVLDDDEIKLAYDTTADDVEDWDSLSHIELIVALEKHFNIRFRSDEIQTFSNVGAMSEAILTKLG